ncbi:MAG: hypothetical protein A2015_10965 [Spirochaetes bacterium GWF1_31_7]|nr:MAG: hypothetical protein A2Y30_13100 [Spirochaetes bacterium GWE1_32_154]OHD48378.1 MAG: hypothetical protein A2015_10965 [Spirochaetes bacterium GWF1_31_7]OHD50471.1 MAG: hypothetical protein A2Y29_11145 [Spirochaetes bacterium GWE2_31_10]OHD82661.1 MAG: hypothetical protein A2355_15165 [Spirochaetes bacterium RIFOXYB1_FULL_32_8]HBD93230.1 hypothetical protein [Spirochaetia bacterium]
MNNNIRTHTFFNLGTQRALYEKVDGYINKEFYIKEYIEDIKNKYKLDRIYRFDMGQNNDGCYTGISSIIERILKNNDISDYIKKYPEFVCRNLRKKIGNLHEVSAEWVLFSAGLEQMISMVASTFLELNDRVLVTSPTFFLFEEYSKRMGAIPIYLPLHENQDFSWTIDTFNEYKEILDKLHPKLIWIANPNNPTGKVISKDMISNIVKIATEHYAFVIIDEAYGEYTDPQNKVNSASSLLHDYNNLIVLRTFSKAYGLANLRIGYALMSDLDIFKAMRIHSTNFPITQFSFDIAEMALNNLSHLEEVRFKNRVRKEKFVTELEKINTISFIKSDTNILMVKHNSMTSNELMSHLEKKGIITSKVPGENDELKSYIRITVGNDEDNNYFLQGIKCT